VNDRQCKSRWTIQDISGSLVSTRTRNIVVAGENHWTVTQNFDEDVSKNGRSGGTSLPCTSKTQLYSPLVTLGDPKKGPKKVNRVFTRHTLGLSSAAKWTSFTFLAPLPLDDP
jgi:hypothetical protein